MDLAPVPLSAAGIASLEVVSVANIDSPTELNSIAGSTVGERRVCYQVIANDNVYTVYYFDSADGSGASSPYVLAASGSGFWIAGGGKYTNSAVSLRSTLAVSGITTISVATAFPLIVINTTANSATSGPFIRLTEDAGAAMANGDRLGGLLIGGARDASHTINSSSGFSAFATEAWSGTAAGSNLVFHTVANTTTTRVDRMTIGQDGLVAIVGAATIGTSLGVTGLATLTAGLTTPAQITSTIATGTAPLVVASTTVVGNLNVSQLLGSTWAVPGTIGSTTPNTGAFTTLSSTGLSRLSSASAQAGASVTLAVTNSGSSATTEYGVFVDWRSDSTATANTRGSFIRAGTAASSYTTAICAAIVVGNAIQGAGSTITAGYGIQLSQQSSATNNYGIVHSTAPSVGNYFLYDDVGYASKVSGVWSYTDTTDAGTGGTASVVLSGGLYGTKSIFSAINIACNGYFKNSLNDTSNVAVTGSNATSGTFAVITVYGKSHASQANRIFYDAARHAWRSATGTDYLIADGTTIAASLPTTIAAASGNSLSVTGVSGQYTAVFTGSSSSGSSFGPNINAGSNSSDQSLLVADKTGGTPYFTIRGDGRSTFAGTLIGSASVIFGGTTDLGGNVNLAKPVVLGGNASDDSSSGGIVLHPVYSGAFTITRYAYLDCNNPVLTSAAVTDATVFRFDAAAGTHKAVDSGTTKTTPGTVNAWVKANVNGTIYYLPAYTSKTT